MNKIKMMQIRMDKVRLFTLLFIVFFLIDIYQAPIRTAALSENRTFNVVLLPFLLNSSFFYMMMIFMTIYFFSDVPFIHRSEQYFIGRMGRSRWGLWNVKYLFQWSVVLATSMVLLSILNTVGCGNGNLMEWSGIMKEFALTDATAQYGIMAEFPYEVLMSYSPIQLLLVQFLMLIAGIFLIGLVLYTGSLFIGKTGAMCLVFLITAVPNYIDRGYRLPTYLYYFMPSIWVRSSYWKTTADYQKPDFIYMLIAQLLLISILIVVGLWKINRMEMKEC